MGTKLEDRLARAASTLDLAHFEETMRGASNWRIVIASLNAIPPLPQEVQNWWYNEVAPPIMDLAEAEVPEEVKQHGREWSNYFRPDAAVVSSKIQEVLSSTTIGLEIDELFAHVETLRSELPHPDVTSENLKGIVVFILVGLLDRKVVWQTEDCCLHCSSDNQIDWPSAQEVRGESS